MNTKQLIVILILIILLIPAKSFSQSAERQKTVRFSIPEIAILDIEPSLNNSVYISLEQPGKPGVNATFRKTGNETLWINYSSTLLNANNSRIIKAEISRGTTPKGINLFLEASNYSGNGDGRTGQSTGKVKLTNHPKPIITNIGNCYTGDGLMNGHSLSFSVEISNYAKIHSMNDTEFTILYTITDN
jgi:hypothetical protein